MTTIARSYHSGGMALNDWTVTRTKIINSLEKKGARKETLAREILEPNESMEDFESLLSEMRRDKIIRNQIATIHLINYKYAAKFKNPDMDPDRANPWVWYAWGDDMNSTEFRVQLRRAFSANEAKIFRSLANIILGEPRPRQIGSRVVGPITEEEGRYITKVNEALRAFLDKLRED